MGTRYSNFSTLDLSVGECVFANSSMQSFPQAVLYRGDCLEVMSRIEAEHPRLKFDMIFADPPYFLSNGGITCQAGRMVKVDKGKWDRSGGVELDHEFNLSWLSQCQRLLTPNGTIWVSGTHHNIYSVGFAMQQLGMRILNNITWEKPNPPPNLSCRYFTHSTETLIWAARSKQAIHKFNYDAVREMNGGKQMKCVWTISPPTSAEKSFGKHPTQKPEALLDRIILSCTDEGDLIMDPFAGSSTTGVVALRRKRCFLGIELDEKYALLSAQRLGEELLKSSFPEGGEGDY